MSPSTASSHFTTPIEAHNDDASVKSISPPTITAPTGTKRKRGTEPKFYAVRVGHRPGLYYTWADCLTQVKGFKNATFQAFTTLTDAEKFMRGETGSKSVSDASVSKFYAVKCGKVPGIYTDWPSAQEQIIGWTKPKHKCFSTRAEAQRFVDERMDLEPPLQRFKEVNGAAKPAKPTPAPEPYDPSSYEPGTGPLPPGAVDGFDPNIILDRKTNTLVYKTPAQMRATKMQAVGPLPDTILRIYTDGAASKNGQLGALAGVGVYFGPGDERNISEPLSGTRQTNQRAELTAVLRALDVSPRDRPVTIITDSRYSIDCVTNWSQNWRKNGWKTSAGKSVENRDLIEGILMRVDDRKELGRAVTFEWVKGHAQVHGNVEADKLAVAGATKLRE